MNLNLVDQPTTVSDGAPVPSSSFERPDSAPNRRNRRLIGVIVALGLLVAAVAGALLAGGSQSSASKSSVGIGDQASVEDANGGSGAPIEVSVGEVDADPAPAPGRTSDKADSGSSKGGGSSGGGSGSGGGGTESKQPPLVVDPTPAHLTISPDILHFGETVSTLPLKVRNTGGSAATVALGSDSSWLKVPPVGAELLPGGEHTFEIKVDRSGLAPGSDFSGNVVVQLGGNTAGSIPADGSKPAEAELLLPSVGEVEYVPVICGVGQGDLVTYTKVQVNVTNATSVKLEWSQGNAKGVKEMAFDEDDNAWWTAMGGFPVGPPVTFKIVATGLVGSDSSDGHQIQVQACK